MLTYGLTGGIGSGKSFVAEIFRENGIPSFDADEMGRELLSREPEFIRRTLERFPDCAGSDGGVDRRKLAGRVFAEPGARQWLEDLLHPAIWNEFVSRRKELPRPLPPACLIEGAVILESRSPVWRQAPLAGFIVVTAPLSIRLRRLRDRDGSHENDLRARMSAQLPQHEKILSASHLIDNGGDLQHTRRQVLTICSQLSRECGGQV